MNILYLIGNGFDLRLGLPTRYEDFLEYYKKCPPLFDVSEASNVTDYKTLFFRKLEDQLELGNEQWKDLELALGKFTIEFGDDVDGFRAFYEDINFALLDYLKEVTKEFQATEEESNKLYDDFLYPEQYLRPIEQNQFRDIIPESQHYKADVITFNYTSSFEALSKDVLSKDGDYRRSNGYNLRYCGITHIHGSLEDSAPELLLGVDNSEQIENIGFKDKEDVIDFLIKPQGNQNYGVLVDAKCKDLISDAHLICLFGLSLGDTDKTWWASIRQRFLSSDSVALLYFHYEDKYPPKMRRDMKEVRRVRRHILDALGIDGNEVDYRNRIFVSINSDIFPKRERKKSSPTPSPNA